MHHYKKMELLDIILLSQALGVTLCFFLSYLHKVIFPVQAGPALPTLTQCCSTVVMTRLYAPARPARDVRAQAGS